MEKETGHKESRWKEYALVLGFFLLLSVVFTWPLILHVHRGVLGGTGDPMLNSWIISWDAKMLFSDPSRLFQGNIIYPARDVVAYSEHMLTMGLLTAPIYFIFRNPVLSYNFLIFFGFVFSGFGCYLLVKELTGSRWAGLAAGVFFALSPYKISRLSHLQIMFSPFLPFMLLYLYRFLKGGGKRNAVLSGAFFVAQSLSSWHYLIFCSLAVGLMWAWTAAFSRGREAWKRLAVSALVFAAALLVILPLSLPYLRAHARLPDFERPLEEVRGYSATTKDYLTVLPESMVYGDAPRPFRLGGIGYEKVLYPGVVILALALAGLALRRREADVLAAFDPDSFRRGALFFALLVGVSFVLTFGPEIAGVKNPLYVVPYNLGLLKFIRVPSRFFILLSLGLAVLGGFGLAKLAVRCGPFRRGVSGVRTAAAALLILLIVELMTVNVHVHAVPTGDDVPEVYRWLAEQGDVRIIELPTSPLRGVNRYDRFLELIPWDVYEYFSREGLLMYFSTYHWKETANGYSGYFNFFYNRIFTEMQGFPSPRTQELLGGLGIDYVIWDWEWLPSQRLEEFNIRLFSAPGLAFVADFGTKSVFRVEAVEAAGPESLGVEAQAPAAIIPDRPFNLGLTVSNGAGLPYVHAEEEPQLFRLRILDAAGEALVEQTGEFRAPFFLQAGESAVLPLRAVRTPAAGSYRMELSIGGGVLGEREFSFPLQVRDMPDSREPGLLQGGVGYLGEVPVSVPAPDGLFPLAFRVENLGDTSWIAALESRDAERWDPSGMVRLGVRWEQEGGPVWEEQRCTLPCDVAPGQVAELYTLVRPPPSPGRYKLFVFLAAEGFRPFGEAIVLDIEVEGWSGAHQALPAEEKAA